jgi:hypothetical protein
MTEADTLAGWERYWRQILTSEYRAAFLLSLDPALARKLLKRLGVDSADDLIAALRGKTVVAIRG